MIKELVNQNFKSDKFSFRIMLDVPDNQYLREDKTGNVGIGKRSIITYSVINKK